MGFKNPEDRRRYAREYHAKRMQNDPKYAEKYRTAKAAQNKKRYNEDVDVRAARIASANKWARSPEGKAHIAEKTKTRSEAGYYRQYMAGKRLDPAFRGKEAALMKARRIANPEKYREISNRSKAKARKERPHLHRGQWLKWSYGMSLEEYQQRLLTQEGKCAFCPTEHTEEKPLVVDHDHGKPKGEGNRWLLCNSCNVMIGAAKESPEILRKAAELLGAYFGTGHRCRLPVAQPHPLAGHGRPLSL